MSAHSGKRIGRYTLKSPLGRGGMGVVWRAWDDQLKRDVALKLLLGKRVSATHAERFRREAESVARIHHPNVIRIHDAGQHGSELFLVMELIEGGSLQQRLDQKGPLDALVAVEWVAKLADALGAAHSAGVLHRDVKPDNVLLRADGEPLLTDFGLAIHEADERLTQSGVLVGTPGFLAPEQGAGQAIDGRADVYALGAVLFACLTGEPPAGRVGALQLLAASERVPDPPSMRVATVPRELDRICLRCLQPRPDKRYSSMQELAAALRGFLGCRGRRRSGREFLVVGALGAALVGVLGWAIPGAFGVSPGPGVAAVPSSAVVSSRVVPDVAGMRAGGIAPPGADPSAKPPEDRWGSWDEARVAGGRLVRLGHHGEGIAALEFALAAEPPLRSQLQIGHDLVRALCQSKFDSKQLEVSRQRADRAEELVSDLERRVAEAGDTLAMTALQFAQADMRWFVDLRRCQILRAEGDLDGALERVRGLAIRFRNSVRIAEFRAECLIKKGAFQEALDYAEEFMELFPGHEKSVALLTCCYQACGELRRGQEQDDYALRLTKIHTNPWFFNHLLMAEERGDFVQAQARYSRLHAEQRANPTQARKLELMRLGFLLGGKKAQDAEAVSMGELKRDPGCLEALLVAGEMHLLWGQYERALKEADAALRVDGSLAVARVLRARALAGLGRYEDTRGEAKLALKLDPEIAHRGLVWDALSVALGELDREEEHEQLLEQMSNSPREFWRYVAEKKREWARSAAEAEALQAEPRAAAAKQR